MFTIHRRQNGILRPEKQLLHAANSGGNDIDKFS